MINNIINTSNVETPFSKELSPSVLQNKPKQLQNGRGSVNRFPLSPALIDTANLDNLYKASQECRRGVNWKDSVLGFQSNFIINLTQLKKELYNGTYKISPYKKFIIYEPKRRPIEATYHKDRVVQRSLCNVYLYKELTRHFVYDNGANQKGKGTDFTRNRLKCLLHRYWEKHGCDGWVCYVDIHSFFDSIPHDVALKEIEKRANDPFALKYCSMVMEKHYNKDVGIGLGSELSQLTGLTVLDGVDHWAKEKAKAKCYVRYMDDSVAVFLTKKEAKFYMQGILNELHNRGLQESPKKTLIFPLKNGINFLGWHYMLKTNGRIICKPKKGKIGKIKNRIRRMLNKQIPINTIKQSLDSSISSLKWGDADKEIKELKNFLKEKIQNEKLQTNEQRS